MDRADAHRARAFIALNTDPEDEIKVVSFEYVEEVSAAFSVRVDVALRDSDLDPDAVVGAEACFRWETLEGRRFVHGVIARLDYLGVHGTHHRFRAVPHSGSTCLPRPSSPARAIPRASP